MAVRRLAFRCGEWHGDAYRKLRQANYNLIVAHKHKRKRVHFGNCVDVYVCACVR